MAITDTPYLRKKQLKAYNMLNLIFILILQTWKGKNLDNVTANHLHLQD